MAQLRAVVESPATLRSAATARAVVRALLPAWGLAPVVDDAELVVSELVSNAVEHAPGSETYELEVSQRGDGVRISLVDGVLDQAGRGRARARPPARPRHADRRSVDPGRACRRPPRRQARLRVELDGSGGHDHE